MTYHCLINTLGKKTSSFARTLLLMTATILAGSQIQPAFAADDYPDRPIRLINPYPPGSPVEMLGRLVGEHLRREWGQPVIVESRTGAGGTVGTSYVAKSKPDGYTLLVSVPSPMTVAPWLYKNLPYDAEKDIRGVWGVESGGIVMVLRNDFPANSVQEFVEYAKANPGKVNYGSAGIGSPQHLAAELFQLRAGARLAHIPYQGAAPALVALLGGQVDVMFDSIINAGPHIKAGKLKGLALMRAKRNPNFPDLPTMAEAGVAGAETPGSIGIFAPSGIEPKILAKLESTISRTMSTPETVEQLVNAGVLNEFLVGDQYNETLKKERALFGQILKEAGVEPQ